VIVAFAYLPSKFSDFAGVSSSIHDAKGNPGVIAFVAVLIGIVLAVLIQQLTGYFTDTIRRPVRDVADTSLTGPATVILSGIALGLESAVYTAVLIALAVFGAFLLGSGSIAVALFAVALAGCGLLTTAGVIVSMDTFGPVSDNAQGIAEMSGDIDEAGARVLTDLDAVGNTPRRSPRASRSPPRCWRRPRCSGRSPMPSVSRSVRRIPSHPATTSHSSPISPNPTIWSG